MNPSTSLQVENGNDINPCNKYEQITTSYPLGVLEYNIHKTSKGIECQHHCHDLYSYTSWPSSSFFNDENLNVIF